MSYLLIPIYLYNMKFIIKENKFIDYIKNKFGFNLNELTYEITSWNDLEDEFPSISRCFHKTYILNRLNSHGPIYVINFSPISSFRQDRFFLFQKNLDSNRYLIFNNNCDGIDDGEIFNLFGLGVLGLSWREILELYR